MRLGMSAFILTSSRYAWFGKPAYLAADPMTIQEGQQAIPQAVTDCLDEGKRARDIHI